MAEPERLSAVEETLETAAVTEEPPPMPEPPPPLPTHWVDFVPEGVDGYKRFDELTLSHDGVVGLLELGFRLCLCHHLPASVTAQARVSAEGELVLLETPEGLHPEHVGADAAWRSASQPRGMR